MSIPTILIGKPRKNKSTRCSGALLLWSEVRKLWTLSSEDHSRLVMGDESYGRPACRGGYTGFSFALSTALGNA
jgi:hypothetical protein